MESIDWTDWHLTPRGWEKGSSGVNKLRITVCAAPIDRVLTARWVQSEVCSGHVERWRSHTRRSVNEFLQRFGEPPQTL